jgi:tetratricopeptide (TPR) repeat protein
MFRLISGDGVNYHDLLLERGEALRIVDIFVHSNGEWISQLVRRGFLPVAARFGGGGTSSDTQYLDNVQNILTMIEHYRGGRYEQALAVFDALPEELKKNRNILMQRFAVAVKAGGELYDAAMVDLKTAFPDDPSLGLVLIDYHFNRGEYDTAIAIIDRLDRDVGGDPYLDFFRANVLYVAGRLEEAKQAARRAIEAEPTLEDPYWTLVTISLDEREFTETARLLTEIENELGLVLGDLGGVPEYREFVESDAYPEWSRRYEAE